MTATSTRKAILTAAEMIFSEKGRAGKIGDISTAAGVNDSVIYHYYKNKEDLIFSVAEERLKDIRSQMEDQLAGIVDPVSKLRKLVWFRLNYVDNNRDYGNLLMFECRSNIRFFQHSAMVQNRWFLCKAGDIVEEGIRTGIFSPDLNVWLFRDILFGILDLTNIQGLIGELNNASDDFEAIINILLQMICMNDTGVVVPKQTKRNRILAAAETIFAEKGYDHAKIQDIAREASVADGTVYDYFKNKEELLFATLRDGFQPSALKSGFQEHLYSTGLHEETASTLSQFKRFIRQHFLICLTQPSFATILILNGVFNKSYYQSEAYITFNNYFDRLFEILDKGKEEGVIRQDSDNRVIKNLIVGAFSHITLRWILSEEKIRLNKVEEINEMISLIVRSVTP